MGNSAESASPSVHRLHDVLGPEKSIRAVILLNGPPLDARLLNLVCPEPPPHPLICADGAADLLLAISELTPTAVVGDLDSVSSSTLAHYKSRGCEIVCDADQDAHDFDKAMRAAEASSRPGCIVVLGGYAGRFDQTLANINVLYTAAQRAVRVVWLTPSDVVTALAPGAHRILVDPSVEGPSCGLLPVGGPVRSVTTSGLAWNLSQRPLSFGVGGLVSSSNRVVERVVHIDTSHTLVWTCELRLSSQ